VEQLVARRAHNPKVAGSSPASATKKGRSEIILIGFFVFTSSPSGSLTIQHMKRSSIFLSSLLLWCTQLLLAQSGLLQSGPMPGFAEMREAHLWVQTTQACEVRFAYWDLLNTGDTLWTESIRTDKRDAFTTTVIADEVKPGIRYGYRLYLNGRAVDRPYTTEFQTPPLWQYRTDPPEFTLALGSCAFINEEEYDRPGRPYGGEYTIFESIHQKRPDLMLWLGDNVYLREVDWNSRTGILKRYTHSRSVPELQALLGSTHHLAIWDDHDFGPNDSDRSFVHKDKTLEAFRLFWANPSYGEHLSQGGACTMFQWGDVDVFMLDNRYHRSPNKLQVGNETPTILGKEQLEWLIDALVYSRAPFKLVAIGGQVLTTAAVFENYIHHHSEERAYLLKRIEEERIRNVVFLTGDRHHSELSHYVNASGNSVYDLTVSPLSSGASNNTEEVNELRVDGTAVFERNFGMLRFSGERRSRQMTITLYDVAGEEIWSRSVKSE
jgi:alkaline phosphatase D